MFNPFKKKEDKKLEALDAELPVKKVRRRKPKEDKRPWGKLERIVVFIVFVSIPVFSIFFFVKSKNDSPKVLGEFTKVSYKNPDGLKTALENELGDQSKNYGIWVEALDGSYKLGINEEMEFDGASLFKIPLMVAYYQAIDNGEINPKTNYTLKYSDSMTGAGVLATLPPGTVVTYQDMVDFMGKNSDNSAFAIMQNTLKKGAEEDAIKKLGMTSTSFAQSTTTPKDIGKMFMSLEKGNLLSSSSKEKLLASLKDTDFENLIPQSIPDSVKVVHKYAANGDELNDAGIVYSSNPFILVILTKGDSNSAQEIVQLTKVVYDWATK